MRIIKEDLITVPSQIIKIIDDDGCTENIIQFQCYHDAIHIRSLYGDDAGISIKKEDFKIMFEMLNDFSDEAVKFLK